jgi:copper(I)-binding protein
MFQNALFAWQKLLGTAFLTLFLVGAASAESIADRVTVTDPYVRAVPPVVKTSAAFMQLRYDGPIQQFLVAAETPAAGAVELHMHEHDNGVMRMRRIPHIHLPPGQTVSLEPGGLHVMLFDLKAPLAVDAEVPITLIFADDSRKEITAKVRSVTRMMKH